MKTEQDSPVRDKHLLVAVDDSESSKRAVLYVADFLGGLPGFTVTLCSIIPAPEPDFFDEEEQEFAWIKEKKAETGKMLENFRQVLIQAGFPEDKVRIRSFMNMENHLPRRSSTCAVITTAVPWWSAGITNPRPRSFSSAARRASLFTRPRTARCGWWSEHLRDGYRRGKSRA